MTDTQNSMPKKPSPDRRKLTPLLIEKTKPGIKRARIWDTATRGLVLQVEPSGSRSWYLYYRRNGRPRWHRLGPVGSLKLRDSRNTVTQLTAKLSGAKWSPTVAVDHGISIDAIQNGALALPAFGFGLHTPDVEQTIPKGVLK